MFLSRVDDRESIIDEGVDRRVSHQLELSANQLIVYWDAYDRVGGHAGKAREIVITTYGQ